MKWLCARGFTCSRKARQRRTGDSLCLLFAFWFAVIAPSVADAQHKVRVQDPKLSSELLAGGGRLVADYGAFQVIETDGPIPDARDGKAQLADDGDEIELHAGRINTRLPQVRALRRPAGLFKGRKLHLIQFAGPVKPEWRAGVEQAGARIVAYVPHNAYLIQADAKALGRVQSWAGATNVVQWDGEYFSDFKLHPAVKLTDAYGFPQVPDTDQFAIQLVEDAAANPATLALIGQWALAPVQRDFRVLHYRNLIVRLPAERLPEIAAQPDVVSVQPHVEPQRRDERQNQIMVGDLGGDAPSGPGYLAWLGGKGFAQEQFTASGFVVDVTDSGIDNGTTAPGHFGLYVEGDPLQPSRVAYQRVEGTPHYGSTTAGLDGHGNLNAHIVAGYNAFTGFPHADAAGYRYGLGVCPFVRIGASVVFDPDTFTSPNYADIQSRAYQDGARISANSWGMTNNSYTVDAQAYDALVRDAQPAGAAFESPGNQEMVILFAAGNSGTNANTVGAPGTAKNVITVGAAENVRSLANTEGGNNSMGNDGCGYSDVAANRAHDLASFSSHGPCSDGRQKPDLVAPGTHVTGGVPQSVANTNGLGAARPDFKASTICALPGGGTPGSPNNFFPLGQEFYTVSSGTSHAVPAAAGACALLRQDFLNHDLPPPSPAMTKAYLMNATRHLDGAGAGDSLWSPGQGMGELYLARAFDGAIRILRDQRPEDIFTASGQTRVFTGRIAVTNAPFRVTLAWTDAPGNTLGNAFNNDLDLTVTVGTTTYRGNVFSGALSVPGGSADARNNVESVFLSGASGEVVVTVTAANLNSDGVPNQGTSLDQDFALVIYNATATQVPILLPVEAAVTAEGCFPTNGVPDDGERVAVNFALKNTGTLATTSLVVTLLATNGVMSPSAPQFIGALETNGVPVSRTFTFTASGSCGGTIAPVLQLQDGTQHLGLVAYGLPLGLTTIQTACFTNATPIGIPDSGKASSYPSIIAIAGVTNPVTKVTATLRGYRHTWPDDVDVLLVGPRGQKVMLMADCGGGAARDGVTLTFDDGALSSVPDNSVVAAGTYKPTNVDSTTDNFGAPAPASPFGLALAAFRGLDPNGDWSLYVQDDGSLDSGSITQGWVLSLTTSNLACCAGGANSADLAVTQVASATVVTLGSNVTFAVTVTNQGPDPAAFVTLTNVLPAGFTLAAASASQGTCSASPGTIISELGNIASGATVTVMLDAVAAMPGTAVNQLSVASLTGDPSWANNTSLAAIEVNVKPATNEVNLVTNTAPVLPAIPNRVVHAGTLVTVTNAATDADAPANTLTYGLVAAPLAATLNPVTGLFVWLTTDADANSTNAILVRVTDDGVPSRSAEQEFVVTVIPRPLIAGIQVAGAVVSVTWTAVPGQSYRLQFTESLTGAEWTDLAADIVSQGAMCSAADVIGSTTQRFYRIRLAP
jgi:uncharacterized repeat protein (TIGR01451 family)